MPRTNQLCRCSAEPCVHDSGTTRPCVRSWMRSSPTDAAASSAWATSWRRQVLDEARFERVPDPETRVAVRLELDTHLSPLRAGVAVGAAQDSCQVLDVVAVLVGEDVRLGERPALGAELGLELVEEAEVDVDVTVVRTVERPDRGRRSRRSRSGSTRRRGASPSARIRGTPCSSRPGCC